MLATEAYTPHGYILERLSHMAMILPPDRSCSLEGSLSPPFHLPSLQPPPDSPSLYPLRIIMILKKSFPSKEAEHLLVAW